MIDELEKLVTEWKAGTEDRDAKSGYERGVDYAFCKAAEYQVRKAAERKAEIEAIRKELFDASSI